LSDYLFASRTVDVEPITMILPAADRSAFFGEDIAAAPALITVPTETPPRKEPTEKAFHFKPSLPPLPQFYPRENDGLNVYIREGSVRSETSEHV
jgi:hypothetical protein